MGLADKLRQEASEREAQHAREQQEAQALRLQKEQAQKEQAERSRLEFLNQSIQKIDSDILKMQSLLGRLLKSHERAGASVAEAKKEATALKTAMGKLEALFKEQQTRELLEGKGISSVEDLMRSDHYAGETDIEIVKNLRENRKEVRDDARTSIDARKKAKTEAYEAILSMPLSKVKILEKLPVSQDLLTYKSVRAALEQTIRELEQARGHLFFQTPEGQESLRTHLLEKVSQQYRSGFNRGDIASREGINKYDFVTRTDLDEAFLYGEEPVKSVLKEFLSGEIDLSLANELETKDRARVSEAVEVIEQLPKRWHDLAIGLGRVEIEKQKTVDRLVELCKQDTTGKFALMLDWHGGNLGEQNPTKLAQAFVDHFSELQRTYLGLRNSSDTSEKTVEKLILDQQELLRMLFSGKSNKVFENKSIVDATTFLRETSYVTALLNPERIELILKEMEVSYENFQRKLTSAKEAFSSINPDSFTFFRGVQAQPDPTRDSIKQLVSFDGKTYITLRDAKWEEVKKDLKTKQQELEARALRLKEQVEAKVDMDLDQAQYKRFKDSEKNHQALDEIERLMMSREKRERLLYEISLSTWDLMPQMSELVTFQDGRLSFASVMPSVLETAKVEVDRLQKAIEQKRKGLVQLEELASIEGDGSWPLYRKKKERDQKRQGLEKEETSLKDSLSIAQQDYEPKKVLDQKLDKLRKCLSEIRRDFSIPLQSGDQMPLRALILELEKSLTFQLTPAQSALYQQYEDLKNKRDKTQRAYEKKWR